jgi:hypothetical protein
VPYSPYLCLRFNCHINVEACISSKGSKYLYKYTCKGGDRAMAQVEGVERAPGEVNEIDDYQDMRSIGASEACWRMLEFDMGSRYPAVQMLQVHMEDEQMITFEEGREEEAVQNTNARITTLTAFFAWNAAHPECICGRGGGPPLPVCIFAALARL